MNFEGALAVVYRAIDTINEFRRDDEKVAKQPDLVLLGEKGCLDSLALLTLVMTVEREIAGTSGREISLLEGSESDLDLERLASPSSLARLIEEKLAS